MEIYNNLVITVKKLSIQLEEKLLWKMLGFLGWGGGGGSGGTVNDHEMELDDGKHFRRTRLRMFAHVYVSRSLTH